MSRHTVKLDPDAIERALGDLAVKHADPPLIRPEPEPEPAPSDRQIGGAHYVSTDPLCPGPTIWASRWGLNSFQTVAVRYIHRAGRKEGETYRDALTKAIHTLELAIEEYDRVAAELDAPF